MLVLIQIMSSLDIPKDPSTPLHSTPIKHQLPDYGEQEGQLAVVCCGSPALYHGWTDKLDASPHQEYEQLGHFKEPQHA